MPPVGSRGVVPSIYLGIDPGAIGGLAALGSDGGIKLQASEKLTVQEMWEWFNTFSPSYYTPKVHAVIEKVGGYVGGGGQPGSAMFNFGVSYGKLIGFLVAARIPFEEITPQTWMKAYSLKKEKEEPSTKWKNRLKERAQSLFPSEKITLATADALLIAEFCRRRNQLTSRS